MVVSYRIDSFLCLVFADFSQWIDVGILSHDQWLPVWIRDLQLDIHGMEKGVLVMKSVMDMNE
jgi:hypothetical protein